MMTITPSSIRNAVARGIGSLILGKALTTESAKIFLLTLACLIAAQAIMVAADKDDKKKQKEEVVAEEMDINPIIDNDDGGGKSKKMEEEKEIFQDTKDLAESYEMVEHDPATAILFDDKEKKEDEKDVAGMILLKDSSAKDKSTENGAIVGGATGLVTAVGIGGISKDDGNSTNRNNSKIMTDESPKIIEFVEQYCDDLIDTAVAEVLNEVVSQVAGMDGSQKQQQLQGQNEHSRLATV